MEEGIRKRKRDEEEADGKEKELRGEGERAGRSRKRNEILEGNELGVSLRILTSLWLLLEYALLDSVSMLDSCIPTGVSIFSCSYISPCFGVFIFNKKKWCSPRE